MERPITPEQTATPLSTAAQAYDVARQELMREGAPMPPIPSDMLGRLDCVGLLQFSTRHLGGDQGTGRTGTETARLYSFTSYLDEVVRGADDFLAFGHDGHGAFSHAMHYYYARGPLAICLQRRWGGAGSNRAAERARVAEGFEAARRLIEAATLYGPAPYRLVAVDSDFHGRRCAAIQDGVTTWSNDAEPLRRVRAHFERVSQARQS